MSYHHPPPAFYGPQRPSDALRDAHANAERDLYHANITFLDAERDYITLSARREQARLDRMHAFDELQRCKRVASTAERAFYQAVDRERDMAARARNAFRASASDNNDDHHNHGDAAARKRARRQQPSASSYHGVPAAAAAASTSSGDDDNNGSSDADAYPEPTTPSDAGKDAESDDDGDS
jgi:hypothetical protein